MRRRTKIKELEKRLREKEVIIFEIEMDRDFMRKRFAWSEECAKNLREEVAALKGELAERTQLLLEVQDKLLLPGLRYNDNTGEANHD